MGIFYASVNQDARQDLQINHAYSALTKHSKGDEGRFLKLQLEAANRF